MIILHKFRDSPLRYYFHGFAAGVLALASFNLVAAPVSGKATDFQAKGGLVEQCIRIAEFPGASYSELDRSTEKQYCDLNLAELALCPKIWSTSPGTILYEIDADYRGGNAGFEKQHCGGGFHAAEKALSEPAIYKMSINGRKTSATFAPSSWVYYHFSRYFQTGIAVPVAVYRSMSTQSHHERVVKPALGIVAGRKGLGMLTAGWQELDGIETGKISGSAANEVLTDDGRQVFGVLLNIKGDRYGPEINGTRESGWGAGQNNDFQQTAPFLALRNQQSILEAVKASVHEARKNPKMAKALPADIPVEQVVFWMKDVSEITLLDYILGQQDRIGNIDYTWRWYWLEDGKLKSRPSKDKQAPAEIAKFNPLRLRQSALNDNDAGVRTGYADFAAKTHMLEGLHHYNADLYQRLGRLAADFEARGAAYTWLVDSAGLSNKEAEAIVRRTGEAFALLQGDCESGQLKLDLEPAALLLPQGSGTTDTEASCNISFP